MILNDLKSTMLHLAMQSTVRHIMEYQLGRDDGCTLQSSGPPCCFWHKSAHEPKPQKATWLERRRLVDPCSHHTSVESNKRKVYFPTHAFKCLSVQAYGTVFFNGISQLVSFAGHSSHSFLITGTSLLPCS